jgi:hypothetical protein
MPYIFYGTLLSEEICKIMRNWDNKYLFIPIQTGFYFQVQLQMKESFKNMEIS